MLHGKLPILLTAIVRWTSPTLQIGFIEIKILNFQLFPAEFAIQLINGRSKRDIKKLFPNPKVLLGIAIRRSTVVNINILV